MAQAEWFSVPTDGQEGDPTGGGGLFDSELGKSMAGHVLNNTRQRAEGYVSAYGNIDMIRPYFDVEPQEVAHRLVMSLIPLPSSPLLKQQPQQLPGVDQPTSRSGADLYGPLMSAFTLSALVLAGLKLSGANVREGTLVGAALFVCFFYWFMSIVIVSFSRFLFLLRVNTLQIISLTGYALFGACLALIGHCTLSPSLSLATTAVFGGLSALSLGIVLMFRCDDVKNGFIVMAIVVVVHFGFIAWLTTYYVPSPVVGGLQQQQQQAGGEFENYYNNDNTNTNTNNNNNNIIDKSPVGEVDVVKPSRALPSMS